MSWGLVHSVCAWGGGYDVGDAGAGGEVEGYAVQAVGDSGMKDTEGVREVVR